VQELLEWLEDPIVRLCNLYRVKDEDGIEVPFRPRPPQMAVLEGFYYHDWNRIAIPKARQIGFSTLAALIALDEAYFGTNKECSIVDHNQKEAYKKLAKASFAYEKLPAALLMGSVIDSDNASELSWTNGGVIEAGMKARGGTNQFLHISEWGPIAYEDPKRSTEIKTGALPSASGKSAKIMAESTFKGGRGGDWYDILNRGMSVADRDRTAKDWHVLFFPWNIDPKNTLTGRYEQISKEVTDYLNKKEIELKIKFSPQQRLWYYKEKEEQGRYMFREHPTVLEESWTVIEDGMIYATEIDKLKQRGRISDDISHYEGFEVFTVFDIGGGAEY